MKLFFIFLMLEVLIIGPLQASSILQIDAVQLASEAELVFEAEVVSTHSEHTPGSNIYTWVDFLVTDMILGDAEAGHVITLRFTGGVVGDLKLDIGSDIPLQGERGIYFVEARDKSLANPLLGWSQGHFKINNDGSLLAGNNQIIIDINGDSPGFSKLSQGVARGIKTISLVELKLAYKGAEKVIPMSITEFKTQITGLRKLE
jgi:hypothetical protein